EIAAQLGMTENAVRQAFYRFRQRYQSLLREEIAHTVATPGDIEDELRHLIAVLETQRMPYFYGVQEGACASDSTMIRVIRICRKCGAKIFSDAPEGLCAKCVLKSALAVPQDAPVAGDDGGSAENVGVNVGAAHDG